MTLTPCQQDAADKLAVFICDPDQQFFVLSGPPGTGKTFLLSKLEKDIIPQANEVARLMGLDVSRLSSIEYTATTNKAASVMALSINARCKTIYSALGFKLTQDFKTGEELIDDSRATKTHDTLFIIDEASMISSRLWDLILKWTSGCKFIFVGDPQQLAPVNEDISKVFTETPPENIVILKTPVRNRDQRSLIDLCNQLRETVDTGVFRPIPSVPGVIDYLNEQEAVEKVTEVFSNPRANSRYLCFTNAKVKRVNAFIRKVRKLGEGFTVGEILTVGRHFAYGKISLAVEEEVQIVQAKHQIFKGGYGHTTPHGDEILYTDYLVTTDTVSDARTYPLQHTINLPVALDDSYVERSMKIAGAAKDWSTYFGLKASFCDLRMREASTVHKSQGSTYESVFIDLTDIGKCYEPDVVARLLFVAVSRATTRVYLIGKLPRRYTGR